MAVSRRRKSAPRIKSKPKKRSGVSGDPRKVSLSSPSELFEAIPQGKTPVRVRKGLTEAFRLGGTFIWRLPYCQTHYIVAQRYKGIIGVALVRNGGDPALSDPIVLLRVESTKTNLNGVAQYLFAVANSEELTKTLIEQALNPTNPTPAPGITSTTDLTTGSESLSLDKKKEDHHGLWTPNG